MMMMMSTLSPIQIYLSIAYMYLFTHNAKHKAASKKQNKLFASSWLLLQQLSLLELHRLPSSWLCMLLFAPKKLT